MKVVYHPDDRFLFSLRSLSGPWDTPATLSSPGSGLLGYHDTTPPPAQAFYRTAQP